jgi:hypothetical protein
VSSYTITISPDDDSSTTTTLRLDTSSEGVRLTDLHLHAGNGLSTGALPAIDYGLLLQAIAPTTPTPVITSPAAPTQQTAATRAPRAEPVASRGRRAGARKSTAPSTGARKATATRGKKATRVTTGSQRAYRRMPDDFATVYRKAGTAAAVADHYDVPRHTAHGWIRRLRDQGGATANR